MTRLRTIFPDREFIMRSEGQVRFIKISSKLQLLAAGAVALLLIVWLVTMAAMAVSQYSASRERLALENREAKVATAENRVSSYREDIAAKATDLERRQQFIEKMVEAHLGDMPEAAPEDAGLASDRDAGGDKADRISAALPEAAGLARIEASQNGFVERLIGVAEHRAERAAEAIRKLGLNPNAVLASVGERTARGGPYMSLATASDGSLDARFQRLGVSLARMDALERGLAGIPQVHPARLEYISSGFGYRSDPFNGSAAFHAGLDFAGPMGAPIYAASEGTVSFAGRKAGYGNCIEIDHGNGLVTRYAHMSRFVARAGEKVAAGDVIGKIGNSGRSTGPHLHFEVRVHDRAVNPRPFLETAPRVLEEAHAG